LYGLAGSGKTTTSKDVLDLLGIVTDRNKTVVASLSGVAANRAKTVTGYDGMTIHSLLGFNPAEGWAYNEKNKLPHEVIMLDECSMIDSRLFNDLIKAIDFTKTILFLVGDPAQIQSIGPGDMYKNVIDSGVCKGVGLDQVFRQKDDQFINIFATKYIREGKMLEGHKRECGDFTFKDISIADGWKIKKEVSDTEWAKYRESNNQTILDEVSRTATLYKDYMAGLKESKNIAKYMSFFQAISPQKAGLLGVENLNTVLQKIFNPDVCAKSEDSKDIVVTPFARYGFFDKIIHLKNKNMKVCSVSDFRKNKHNFFDYIKDSTDTRRVFNGQMGIILDVKESAGQQFISVFYPNEKYITVYNKSDVMKGMIQLSYSLSIHKSQGSEFDITVLPVTYSHYRMLNNQLFYTAFTRAKNKLYVLGEESALKRGVTNVKDTKRDTVLALLFSADRERNNAPDIESIISNKLSEPNENNEDNDGVDGISF
jgi:exodeoxyribonuclease V alpha subunit